MEIFDLHYDVDTAGDFNTVLSTLAMKQGPFSRTKVKNYSTDFIEALLLNPNYIDPFAGGTTEELINIIFISGLQPLGFRKRVSQFGTKDVDSSYDAIQKVLPRYQDSIDVGFTQPDLPVVKAPAQPFIHKQKASMSFRPKVTYDCNHCKQPGHDQKSCPFKANVCIAKPRRTVIGQRGALFLKNGPQRKMLEGHRRAYLRLLARRPSQ